MRAVNPVHFFDALGRSVLEKSQHIERIQELEAEVKRLTTLVMRLQARLHAFSLEEE